MKSFPPRLAILPAPQAELWGKLAPVRDLGFVLYGGTAIALRLGHRHSVDFGFFTHRPLERAALKQSMAWFSSAVVLQDEPESLTVLAPGGVKVSFFGGLKVGRVGEPEASEDGVIVAASLEDLLAFKLKLVVQRVEAKDYLDVAAILRSGVPLGQGLAAAETLLRPRSAADGCAQGPDLLRRRGFVFDACRCARNFVCRRGRGGRPAGHSASFGDLGLRGRGEKRRETKRPRDEKTA